MGAACGTVREVKLPMRQPPTGYEGFGDSDTPQPKRKSAKDRIPTPMPAELMRVWTRRGIFETESPEMFGRDIVTPTRMSGPHPVDGSIHPLPREETGRNRRNTVTPTRMSVAHPIDGSIHPLPLSQMKQRHHSLTNPNIQWPTAEIIQRSVRRSNSKQTRVFLSGGDSVVPTRLPSNISIASLTSEIEHGVDGSILSSSESDQSIVQMKPRQLPPITPLLKPSEPNVSSRQACYMVGADEDAVQRAGPALDFEEVFNILMTSQQRLYELDMDDVFEDKCAKLTDEAVPITAENATHEPESYEDGMIAEIGGDMEKTAKEFGNSYRVPQSKKQTQSGRSSASPRKPTEEGQKLSVHQAARYPSSLNPFTDTPHLIDANPDSKEGKCSIESEAVPENFAAEFVTNIYQSAPLKHRVPSTEAPYVSITRSSYSIADDAESNALALRVRSSAEMSQADAGPSKTAHGRNTVTSMSSAQSVHGAGDMQSDIGGSMTPVEATLNFHKNLRSNRGSRASSRSTAANDDINTMKGVMGACVNRLEAETSAQRSPSTKTRVETVLTDKTVSIKCACEMSTSENVTHVITELDAGAGAAQINTGILLTAGSIRDDVSSPRIREVTDEEAEEIMGSGANPFVEAQITREARNSVPAHLKDPVDNVHHEAVPAVKLCPSKNPQDRGTHTYYEEPLKGLDDGKELNVGTETVLPDKDGVTNLGVAVATSVFEKELIKDTGMTKESNVAGVSMLKRDLSPVPTDDKQTSDNQCKGVLAPLRPTRRLPPIGIKNNKNEDSNMSFFGSATTDGKFVVMPK